jgi:hypothetical protein
MSVTTRILLFLTGLLAAWQVAVGIDKFDTLPIIAYTIGFGVLLVAVWLLLILGMEILDSPAVVIVSTIIPLSLSLGLVWQFLEAYRMVYLIFSFIGFCAVTLTRLVSFPGRLPVFTLAFTHGIAGIIIFLLPIWAVLHEIAQPGFSLVGLGGGLIGLGGLLLSFLKMGKPILPRKAILKILPAVLLAMTMAFVTGFLLNQSAWSLPAG